MLQLQAAGATSTDDLHPAEHCLDGNPETFWLSTGLFPQELVLSLPSPTRIVAVHLRCCNVKQMSLQHSTEEMPGGFTELAKSGNLEQRSFVGVWKCIISCRFSVTGWSCPVGAI
ncbi:Intraflagellar transport protein 25 homolog [Geodia barretti]|uniref:Intraflagellar transport protein 25 homolog n=1 Tax=Geodia barretti TaxID=519541 RepID=A0AA35RFM0_GEOBA|nr:Intraflagellar transport protein 25 homolog [Geodia barretti]